MFRVLVVEDNQAVRRIIEVFLEREGLDVTALSSGDEVEEVLLNQHRFEVAIIDQVLPGILQGTGVKDLIRQRCPEIGIVQISGNLTEILSMTYDHDYDVCLRKPLRREQLIEAVFFAYQANSILKRKSA